MKKGQNIDSNLSRLSKNVNLIVFLILYATIALLISLKPINKGGLDYWMHAGSIAIFSQNIANPQHTYDEAEAIRVRNFSPYQAILAIVVKLFGLTPIDAFTLGALVSVGLLFLGIWLMSNVLGTSPWLSSCLLFSVLFFVGRGFGWSTEIYAHILPITGGYPSTLSIALSLICWYNVDRLLVKKSLQRLCWVTILIALVLLIHQLVFLHFTVFLFFWVALSTTSLRNKLYIFCAIVASFPLVLLWPYFSPFSVSYAAVTGAEHRPDNVYIIKMASRNIAKMASRNIADFKHIFFVFSAAAKRLGPALLGLLLLPTLPSKVRLRLVFLVAFTLFMWFVGPKIHMPTAGRRWAMPCMLLLQFVIGIHIAKLVDFVLTLDLKQTGRAILTLSIVGLVTIIILSETKKIWVHYSHYIWPPHNITLSWTKRWERFSQEAKLRVKNDDPIAADFQTSYSMTAFQLRPVVFSRKKNSISELLIRLYSKDTSVITRIQILKNLGVQYFIIESGRMPRNVEKEMSSLGEEVLSRCDIRLYKVK